MIHTENYPLIHSEIFRKKVKNSKVFDITPKKSEKIVKNLNIQKIALFTPEKNFDEKLKNRDFEKEIWTIVGVQSSMNRL